MFNLLAGQVNGARFLDLFAGSGVVGLEAISRGASSVTFVDASRLARRIISENARRLGVLHAVRIMLLRAEVAIVRLVEEGALFDIVFLDPPYNSPLGDTTLQLLGDGELFASGGVCIAEHSRRHPPSDRYGVLVLTDRREYGDTCLSVYSLQAG